ncbi:MAG: alpha-2-macroglobulin family protein [Bacteroidota bacterium]
MKSLFGKNQSIYLFTSMLAIILLASFSYHQEQVAHNKTTCLFTFDKQHETTDNQLVMNFDYEKAWAEINDLARQGLPKSALEKVNQLIEKAREEEEHSQFIKGVIYRGNYESQLEEDGFSNAILKLQNEMESAGFPVKPILQSMLGEMYVNYLDQNRYQFQNRTNTVEFNNEDIRTWPIEHFMEESAKLYWLSLTDNKSKTTDIKQFEILLSKGKNDAGLRPTLYDFLAHRAIDQFMNERNYLAQPAYKFEIEDSNAFSKVRDFIKWEINTQDTTSQKFQTLKLFQELLAFRSTEKRMQSPSLLDADLKRLKFVQQNSIHIDKDELYLNALKDLAATYEGSEGLGDVNAAIASHFYSTGSNYLPVPFGETDEDERKWHWKKAYEYCEQTVKAFPNTVAASDCLKLMNQITAKNLTLETEMVNLPNQPFLGKLEFRNIDKAYFKVIPFTQNDREAFEKLRNERNWKERAIKFLNSKKHMSSWSVELPDQKDFHQHAGETSIGTLPKGMYAILVSSDEGFTSGDALTGFLFTHISNIGFWERKSEGKGVEFVVFDRGNGRPVAGAEVEFWVRSYNSVFRKYEKKKRDTQISDENGFVKNQLTERTDRNFSIHIKHADDELITDQNFYNNYYRNEPRPYQKTEFFLDRAIYRPGQTVYFKGVALSFDKEKMPSILKNQKVEVTLRDANYQEVSKLNLQTNEYGTFSGQFVSPRGGLLGNMSLVSSIGGNAKTFKVEEYKRPKFEVTFDPVGESYRINDQVTVNGNAKAYAGNQIDGANVTWRVVRKTSFPWYWYRWGRLPWMGETMEIAHGTATTDENGNFDLEFKAVPDKRIHADKKPQFNYTIYADVTDITGETQSGESSVKVGYIAMNVSIPMAEQTNVDSLKKLDLLITNLNGQKEEAQGSIVVELLQSPDQIFIDRYWQPTDTRLLPEATFKKNFPQFAWRDEDAPANWNVEKIVLQETFDTEKSTEISLDEKALTAGWYRVTVETKDRFGEPVELKKQFSLFDLNGHETPSPTVIWHQVEQKKHEPGSTIKTHFGTSRKNQPVLIEYGKDGETLLRKWLTVEELVSNDFEVQESHRGNLSYAYSFAALNRSSNLIQSISVPWSNKDLQIEFGTFRDKLQPGQEEEWLIKINGPKGEKVAAEMVAGMYDASLDAFAPNYWGMNLFPISFARLRYSGTTYKTVRQSSLSHFKPSSFKSVNRQYDRLNWFNWNFGNLYFAKAEGAVLQRSMMMDAVPSAPAGIALEEEVLSTINIRGKSRNEATDGVSIANNSATPTEYSESPAVDDSPTASIDNPAVKVRTNLNETVFFFPHLMTDEEGNILIKFKMNEALTKWKFLGLAHTPDLQSAVTTKEVITQKDLMVVPNPPRFFRENDEIEFTAKVVNLTDQALTGNAELQLVNPFNSMPVYKWLDNPQFNQNFEVAAKQSARLAWRFKVPDVADVPVIEHTVSAVAGDFSDGERSAIPVLSNRMLVTETKPLPVRGKETKKFVFESLKNNSSSTLRHQGLTLEFTQNPAWYAVQALPYLMEYPYECTEQIFSRFYANSLATSVANSHPKIKTVFDKWKDYEPDALMSNLSKNQELKTALLEETPWVLQAQSEELQKQNIGLLFDLNRMAYEQDAALKKLQDRQMAGGGWAWFSGGRDNWYITQYLVEGFGHLQKLNVSEIQEDPATWQMIQKAVKYCDDRIVEQYEKLEKLVSEGKTTWDKDHLNYMAAHYLYTRSFFLEPNNAQASTNVVSGENKRYLALNNKAKKVHDYYLGQAKKYWLNKGMYTEGMLSLALFRNGNTEAARKVIRSLKERSLNHAELGMYWKYPSGWWWYQAPIETHALLIEAFTDISDDQKSVDDLKVWLLKNKQTNHWKTTKATAAAVYALLSSGDNWLLDDAPLDIKFTGKNGKELTNTVKESQKNAEAGTGYFKTRIDGGSVDKSLADLTVSNPNNVVAWGAMYWQYFEQLDKITTFEETPLTIKKQLFRVENSDRGEVMRPVVEGEALQVGEKLNVRIELRVDRDMEYVHMKDMRASGFEPINVLSSYKWQGGLGYYESTRDASTNFFFSRLPKGTHVFEYPLRVQHNGDFSNGITTIQCMYAPEFTSHSEGIRVAVSED